MLRRVFNKMHEGSKMFKISEQLCRQKETVTVENDKIGGNCYCNQLFNGTIDCVFN